jgi:hypothetical protein
MVVTHSNNTQEKWKIENLNRFQKTKCWLYPLPFTYEVLNKITWYELYSFLDGYSGYHQISIAQEDKYNIAFVID